MRVFVAVVTFVSFMALLAVIDQIRTGQRLATGTHVELSWRVLMVTWGAVLLALEFFGG